MQKVDVDKFLAAGECQLIGQWEQSKRRHAKEVEGRTARRAAQKKYMENQKKRGLRNASQAASTHCGLIFHTNCVCPNFACTNDRFKWRDGQKAGTS